MSIQLTNSYITHVILVCIIFRIRWMESDDFCLKRLYKWDVYYIGLSKWNCSLWLETQNLSSFLIVESLMKPIHISFLDNSLRNLCSVPSFIRRSITHLGLMIPYDMLSFLNDYSQKPLSLSLSLSLSQWKKSWRNFFFFFFFFFFVSN